MSTNESPEVSATAIVDARGELCPRPVILTRQALKSVAVGSPVRVLVDNETSRNNVERYLCDHGASVSVTREGGVFALEFAAPSMASPSSVETPASSHEVAPTAAPPPSSGWVLSLAGDSVGRGAEDLGRRLALSLLTTVPHLSSRPSTVVLYSSGVLLAVDDTPTAAALAEVARAGVEVLLCGTCVDYYDVRSRVRVGTITDMLRILGVLSGASKVIAP